MKRLIIIFIFSISISNLLATNILKPLNKKNSVISKKNILKDKTIKKDIKIDSKLEIEFINLMDSLDKLIQDTQTIKPTQYLGTRGKKIESNNFFKLNKNLQWR